MIAIEVGRIRARRRPESSTSIYLNSIHGAAAIQCNAAGNLCDSGNGAHSGRDLRRHCYSVAQRTKEVGIRMALGEQRSDVLKMVIGYAAKLLLIGLPIAFFNNSALRDPAVAQLNDAFAGGGIR